MSSRVQLKNLQSLQSLVSDCRGKIGILKSKGTPDVDVNLLNTEAVIHKMYEKDKRKDNIMFNIPEQMNDQRNDQIAADKPTVQKVASTLGIPLSDPNLIRL